MAQGRPRKSKEIKDLQGTSRKDRERKNRTLHTSSGKFGLPRGLSKTVQRHCSKIAKYLKDSGAPIDFMRPMFERYCKCLEISAAAYKDMTRDILLDEKTAEYIAIKKGVARGWKENSAAALSIERQFEVLLRKAKPPKPGKTELEKFQEKGKKLKAVK